MPSRTPISPELWARIRRLDAACSLHIDRVERRLATGQPYRLWLVRIAADARVIERHERESELP
jgi:hypothetical protein